MRLALAKHEIFSEGFMSCMEYYAINNKVHRFQFLKLGNDFVTFSTEEKDIS